MCGVVLTAVVGNQIHSLCCIKEAFLLLFFDRARWWWGGGGVFTERNLTFSIKLRTQANIIRKVCSSTGKSNENSAAARHRHAPLKLPKRPGSGRHHYRNGRLPSDNNRSRDSIAFSYIKAYSYILFLYFLSVSTVPILCNCIALNPISLINISSYSDFDIYLIE